MAPGGQLGAGPRREGAWAGSPGSVGCMWACPRTWGPARWQRRVEKSAFHTRLQGLVYPADWEGSDKIRFKWKEKPCLGGEIASAGMSSGQ